ncbi:MAG TPA: hypothetical protein VKA46_08965 [Gemmataceae bacterium]|nr:hypothetical protein [Gemmataceae bacterium]
MVQRKDDNTPPPPGGRAAERLRQFEDARRPTPDVGEDEGEVKPAEGEQPEGEQPEQLPEQPPVTKGKQRGSQSS